MKYAKKTNSRIIAMMVLYNCDINKFKEDNFEEEVINTINFILSNNVLEKNDDNSSDYVIEYDDIFLKSLVKGILEKRDYIDYIISLCTERYTLDALSYVDRNILRCGTYEIIYMHTPKQIVINELVNVARAYSEIEGFKASKFDNAILDKIANANFKEE